MINGVHLVSGKQPAAIGCSKCREHKAIDIEITMAFQPIVDLLSGQIFAYEALVRGPAGESAASVLAQITPDNRYMFDQRCRVAAIETAVTAGILQTPARLSINFLPNAVYSPLACIQLTLQTATTTGLPTNRLIFEFTEGEEIINPDHTAHIVASYQKMGFGTALDDFGAGYGGLGLLARFQPDIIKLDMELIRGVEASRPRRVIVASIVKLGAELGIKVIAEGIETEAELAVLRELDVRYVQGYLFARPALGSLPQVSFSVATQLDLASHAN